MAESLEPPGVDAREVSNKLVRMWIVDVVNAPANHPTDKHAITFQNFHIKKVNVCGVVTSCNHMRRKTLFTLDDGTGSIVCVLNYGPLIEKAGGMEQIKARLDVLSQTTTDQAETECLKALSVITSFIDKKQPYQGEIMVGDHRLVSGFVSNYFDDRRINAYQRSQPLTEKQAAFRMVRMAKLYQEVYAKNDKAGENDSMLSKKPMFH